MSSKAVQCGHLHRCSLCPRKTSNPRQKDLNEVESVLVHLAAQTNLTPGRIPTHCGIQGSVQADRLQGKVASWAKRTGTPLTSKKKRSKKKQKQKQKPLTKIKRKHQQPSFNQSDNLHKQSRAGHPVLAENWARQT